MHNRFDLRGEKHLRAYSEKTKMANIGDRIGAIVGEDGETGLVSIFGYGIYLGEQIPSDDVIFMGSKYIEIAPGMKNPAIKLDNGDIVYGCECWWGSEEKVKEIVKGKEVEIVSVKEYREEALGLSKQDKEN